MHDRLEIAVSYDLAKGYYIGIHPELRTPVVALSLAVLRKRVEERLIGEDIDIKLVLDATAPTATDALTQTAASDEAAASAEALTQVAPTPSLTFEQHIVRWLDEHPEPSEPGRCAYCGEMGTRGRPVVPFETAPSTHAWLHSGCWRAWRGQRRFRALMAVGGGKLPG